MRILSQIILFVTILSVSTQYGASFTPQQREARAARILARPLDERYAWSLHYQFKLDRKRVKRWFVSHAQQVQDYLNERLPLEYRGRVKMVLGGSYYWKTNHILSDFDALIVVDAPDIQEIQFLLARLLDNFYYSYHPEVTTFTRFPKPNIFVFKIFNYSDACMHDIRLDIGFKTAADYAAMLQDEQQALDQALGKDRLKRVAYVRSMMDATYHRDFERKKRLRIVPAWERE
jgi:hypothetical protein